MILIPGRRLISRGQMIVVILPPQPSPLYCKRCIFQFNISDQENKCEIVFYALPTASWSEPLEQISSQRLQGNDEDNSNFTPPELRGRISQPGPVVPCSKNSLSEAIAPIMSSITNPVSLGQGTQHILPASYFENRRAMLEKLPKYQDVDWETVGDRLVFLRSCFLFWQDSVGHVYV